MARLMRRLLFLLRHRRLARELAEEMELHRTLTEQRLLAEGADPDRARVGARRLFGSSLLARDGSRDVWIWPWLQSLAQDVTFAFRLFARDRGFVLTAVSVLALGIGMTNAIFTMVNAAVFSGLPKVDDRIVHLGTRDAYGRQGGISWVDLEDWRAGTTTFQGMAAIYTFNRFAVADSSAPPDILIASRVTPNAFQLLDVQPVLGRGVLEEDERTSSGPVILSYALWQRRYGGDPGVLGRVAKVEGNEAVIVGVMPEGFEFPFNSQFWQSLSSAPQLRIRDRRIYSAFGRLSDGTTEAQARRDLEALAARLAQAHPATNAGVSPVVERLSERQTRGMRGYLVRLAGAIVFVLLIGCANVASLLLARSAHRAREMAFRVMLGATRWRLVRQLLVESVLLALAAGAVGMGVSALALPFFAGSVFKPYWVEWTTDGRVLSVLIATCLGTALLFGLVPALHLSRTSINDVVRDGSRTGGGAAARAHRWMVGLLAVEFALTLTLLSSVGLMLRGFLILYQDSQVIDASDLMTMQVRLGAERYNTQDKRGAFYSALQERLAAIPEVASLTLASELPLAGGFVRRLSIDGRPVPTGQPLPFVTYVIVGAGYFETLGLPLRRGRPFNALDGTAGHDSAIVNQRFVDIFFPDQDPIGQLIRLSNPNVPAEAPPPVTIVGVSTVIRHLSVGSEQPDPVVYVPFHVDAGLWASLIVRPRTDPGPLMAAVRRVVSTLDPEMPLFNIMPLEEAMARSRGFARSILLMLGVFAAMAVLLASVGIYAVTAYAVGQRRREIGVRMALGAQPSDVIALFVRRATIPLALGVAGGLGGAAASGRLLRVWLADRATIDLPTLGAVAVLLALVVLAAAFIPSRRAARIDPNAALRFE